MSENYRILIREVSALLLFVSAFLVPWWLVVLLGVIGMVFFDLFVEALIVGWYLDVVFSPGGVPQLTVFLAAVLIVTELIRRYL